MALTRVHTPLPMESSSPANSASRPKIPGISRRACRATSSPGGVRPRLLPGRCRGRLPVPTWVPLPPSRGAADQGPARTLPPPELPGTGWWRPCEVAGPGSGGWPPRAVTARPPRRQARLGSLCGCGSVCPAPPGSAAAGATRAAPCTSGRTGVVTATREKATKQATLVPEITDRPEGRSSSTARGLAPCAGARSTGSVLRAPVPPICLAQVGPRSQKAVSISLKPPNN